MNGGVSHMETFDPKPMLTKYAGKTISETPYANVLDPKKLAVERVALPIGARANTLFPLQDGFRKYGESGIEVCNNFPRIGANVDKLAIVRSMWTTDSNHGAQTQFHSGRHFKDGSFPTLDAHKAERYPQDKALAARVASYELAYRMQMSVPDVIDFSKETPATKKLYG